MKYPLWMRSEISPVLCPGANPRPPLALAAALACLSCSVARAETEPAKPIYAADFEAPGYTPGDVKGQQGWTLEQGRAEIVTGTAHGGTASLQLFGGEPFTQAKLQLPAPDPLAHVTFVDFWILPVAAAKEKTGELLDVDGARLGFFRTEEDPQLGEFWVFDGNPATEGDWVQTGLRLPVAAESGLATQWARITLRQDFARQIWDVSFNGRLVGANLGFQDASILHTENYIIMGDATESVFLDDLLIQSTNPLGPDTDADGMLDVEEAERGWLVDADDRDLPLTADVTRLEALVMGGQTPGLLGRRPRPVPPPSAVVPAGTENDADADLMPDDWELAHGLDPQDSSDGALDPDGDGFTNLEETLHGTDPHQTDERSSYVRQETGEVATRLALRVERAELERAAQEPTVTKARERLEKSLRHQLQDRAR